MWLRSQIVLLGFGFFFVCAFLNTNLGVFFMVTQSRFTRSPTWTVEEAGQFVADCFVGFGLFPQITIVVQLKEKIQKSNTYFFYDRKLLSN